MSPSSATAEVVHGGLPYDVPQMWSKALSGHKDDAHGIAYYARHDDEALCYALFDRAGDAVRVTERRTDLDQDWFWRLASRYKVGLAPLKKTRSPTISRTLRSTDMLCGGSSNWKSRAADWNLVSRDIQAARIAFPGLMRHFGAPHLKKKRVREPAKNSRWDIKRERVYRVPVVEDCS